MPLPGWHEDKGSVGCLGVDVLFPGICYFSDDCLLGMLGGRGREGELAGGLLLGWDIGARRSSI